MQKTTQKNYLPYLDCARAMAVLLVFWVHFSSLYLPEWSDDGIGHVGLLIGHQGVNLFFVLSGYLLYHAFLQKPHQPIKDYLKKRAFRIFPAYWATFAIYVSLILLGFTEKSADATNLSVTTQLLLNTFLLSPFFSLEPWISVSWTLTYEWVWYLVLPVIFMLNFHRLSLPFRVGILSACTLSTSLYWGSQGGPEVFSLFFWGALLAEWQVKHGAGENLSARHFMLFAWPILIFLAVFLHDRFLPISILLSGLGWSFLLLLSINQQKSPGIIAQKMMLLGRWSYSFYLLHSLALHGTQLLLPGTWPTVLHFSFSLTLSIVLAYLSYHWIERLALSFVHKNIYVVNPKSVNPKSVNT